MKYRRGRMVTAVSTLPLLALTLSACGSAGGSGSVSAGSPVNGGTLRLLGASDVDHLDTASAYYTTSYTLERAFARQLFSYPTSTDITQANTPSRMSPPRSRPRPTVASAPTARRIPSISGRA